MCGKYDRKTMTDGTVEAKIYDSKVWTDCWVDSDVRLNNYMDNRTVCYEESPM